MVMGAAPLFGAEDGDDTEIDWSNKNLAGIGIIVGEPTGLSGKLWFSGGMAVDAAVAWSFLPKSSLYLHSNLLYHFRVIDTSLGNFLTPYAGAGVGIKLQDTTNLGLRFPIGISMIFESAPIEIFLEVSPGLGLVPETDLEIGAGLGGRVFFLF